MSKNKQTKLSPIERKARKSVARSLYYIGFPVSSVARIMALHVSTASRLIESDEDTEDLDTMIKDAL